MNLNRFFYSLSLSLSLSLSRSFSSLALRLLCRSGPCRDAASSCISGAGASIRSLVPVICVLALARFLIFHHFTVARRCTLDSPQTIVSAHLFCSRFIERCGFLDVLSSILIPPRRDFSNSHRSRLSSFFLRQRDCLSLRQDIYVTRISMISSQFDEISTTCFLALSKT